MSWLSLRRVAGALVAAVACAGPAQRQTDASRPADSVVAITGAVLWDGTGRPPLPNAVTLVKGDRVLCAGTAGQCPVPRDARVVDATGRWLIPGLIDSHVHLLFLHGGSAEALQQALRDLLAQGVTTLRDMGSNPRELLARVHAQPYAPRVYAMQLVAGRRFFYNGFHGTPTARGTVFREAPARTMQRLGWTPILFTSEDDPDSVVAEARAAGATGLKLYAHLDRAAAARLADAAHRAGLTVWGHAWVQPASALEQVRTGHDGVVHAAGLAGELYTAEERDTLVADGALQVATAARATVAAAHDSAVIAALDTMARRGTYFEPTLDAVRHSVASYDAKGAHRLTEQEEYVRAATLFGMELTRVAVARGVRISAGSDHVAYGAVRDRASLFGELQLLVDSIGLSPADALLAATRDAAGAIGGDAARTLGTIEAGRYADFLLLNASPLADIRNLEQVEWVMQHGKLLRPAALRSGIAIREGAGSAAWSSQ